MDSSAFLTFRSTCNGQQTVHRWRVLRTSRRIQFDCKFEGVRYRPTIQRPPSESNLRRARERLAAIKLEIAIGTFSFVEESPDYRFLARLTGTAVVRTCDQVFDDFLAHCESRRAKDDMAAVTVTSYRRVLKVARVHTR